MKYELFIGLRYLQARRQETFISLITVISVLGVMIGVMTLNVVMAVMTGFEETLRDRLLGINAHIALVKSGDMLQDYERLMQRVLKEDGVVAATPTIYGQIMLTSGSRVSGVRGSGCRSGSGQQRCQFAKLQFARENLRRSKLHNRYAWTIGPVLLPGIILGERLANQLGGFRRQPCASGFAFG
jgi:lipoprotein-releasing system permease protein